MADKNVRAAAGFGGDPEYLLARSRGDRPFRRAGVTFGPRWQAFRLDDLGRPRVEQILREPAVQSQLATADQVKDIIDAQGPDTARRPMTELEALRDKVGKLETQVADLKGRLMSVVEKGKISPP